MISDLVKEVRAVYNGNIDFRLASVYVGDKLPHVGWICEVSSGNRTLIHLTGPTEEHVVEQLRACLAVKSRRT